MKCLVCQSLGQLTRIIKMDFFPLNYLNKDKLFGVYVKINSSPLQLLKQLIYGLEFSQVERKTWRNNVDHLDPYNI